MSAIQMWLWLATREEVSPRMRKDLVERFGTPEAIYAADRATLAAATELRKTQVDCLMDKSLHSADQIAADCQRLGISILSLADSAYPQHLYHLADPPTVLYVRGILPDLDACPGLAIVGTRKASPYGIQMAESMAAELAQNGFIVVSGMAEGIDGAASRGALRANGVTVAVFGCGIDYCYPHFHQQLMGDILITGAVLSEYPPGTPPAPKHFPARNRVISGLCRGTLIIEAPERSGALITARMALEQGRDVFAVPGNLNLPSFVGSNQLLANGEAAFVASAMDIVREYAGILPKKSNEQRARQIFQKQTAAPSRLWDQILKKEPKPQPKTPVEIVQQLQAQPSRPKPALELTEIQRAVLQAVDDGACTMDQIVMAVGAPIQEVSVAISILEIGGRLHRKEGRLFTL